MKVPFLDLSAQHNKIKQEINKAIDKIIKNSDFILGEDVRLFEKEFAQYSHTRYAIGVSSGTAALFLALKAISIKEGDEVIVPAFTYIATAFAVSYTGAKPVFVDIDEKTYNINTSLIKKAITKNTKAIMPVHLFGQPADMQAILDITKEYKLRVVEDAAQAHGAQVRMADSKWKRVGSIGDAGCFSFYPTKNLGGMGDGGLITTNGEELYRRLLKLRDYGRISKYEHDSVGYNSRLDTLQAAILRIKLKKLESWNKMRSLVADTYNKFFIDKDVIAPHILKNVKSVHHVYAIRIKNRDKVQEKLRQNGIGTMIYYLVPLHLQKAYSNLGYKIGDFPVSEKIAKDIIALPIHPFIKRKEIEYVVKQVLDS